MKKLAFLLIFAFTLTFGQSKEFPLKNEDFSEIILNKQMIFDGKILKDSPFKLKFENVLKNPEKPDIYLVSGSSDVEGNKSEFLGEMIFSEKHDVKGSADQMLVFGDFYFIEKKSGEHSGVFKGKFRIQTGKNLKAKDGFSTITFKGKWKNYSGNLDFDVWWANFIPSDISKVIFK
jgi:hypothetical protein